MRKTKTFDIDGVSYHVAPLCQAQEDILLEILGEIGIINTAIDFISAEDENTELNVDRILIDLGHKRLIPKFLSTILVPVNEKFNEIRAKKMEAVMAQQSAELKFDVWPDFLSVAGMYAKRLLSISPAVKKKVENLLANQGLQNPLFSKSAKATSPKEK